MKDNFNDFHGHNMVMISAGLGFQGIKTSPSSVLEFVFCEVVDAAVYTWRPGANTNLFCRLQTC